MVAETVSIFFIVLKFFHSPSGSQITEPGKKCINKVTVIII